MSLLFKHKLKYFIYVILAVALVTVGFVTYLVWLQPPFNFPKPTGHYAVGTKLYHWIDTQRKDIHSNNPAHPYQELMVKIWFPAKGISPEQPTTPYAPDLFAHIKKTKPLAALLSGASRQLYVYETSDATLSPAISYFYTYKYFNILISKKDLMLVLQREPETRDFGVPLEAALKKKNQLSKRLCEKFMKNRVLILRKLLLVNQSGMDQLDCF